MGATSMGPTDDELQLKAQVTSTLTDRGVLGKIKAQLRAAVFDVMHEQGEHKRSPSAPQLEDFPQEGAMAMEIVMEFLAFFQFEHALQVLQTEANRTAPQSDGFAESMRAKLGLSTTMSSTGKAQPVLLQMLNHLLQSGDRPEALRPGSSVVKMGLAGGKDSVSPAAAENRHDDAKEIGLSTADEGWQDEDDWKPSRRRVALDESPAPQYKVAEGDQQEHRDIAASDNMEESMAEEEILSGSEIDESVAEEQSASVNYSQDYSTSDFALPEKVPVAAEEPKQQHEDQDEDRDDQSEASEEEEDESTKFPPPVPAKLPAFDVEKELPPVATATTADNFDDEDSDADAEAARLNALDAKLKAMEAEDESGVLQLLKASLQAELQQQDDHEDAASKADEDHDPYGSDFEEEEVVSEISEEVESVADMSDQEDDESGAHDDKPISQLAAPLLPSVVLTDKIVEGKDALNSYDYIEDVERD